MKSFAAVLALCTLALLAACSFSGRAIDRSLSGLLPEAEVAPRGSAFLVVVLREELAPTPFDYYNRPMFARFDVVGQGADFRIVPGAGFLNVPPDYISDSRSLYVIPGQRSRYVLEYNEIQGADQSRRIMATVAERRCQGDTCALAIAESLPIGDEPGQIQLPDVAACEATSCPLDAQAFAAAASRVANQTSADEFDSFFLIYQDAQAR